MERVIFQNPWPGELCERCHRDDRPLLKLIPLADGRECVLCVICLAEGIEYVTGWRVHNQMAQWLANWQVSNEIKRERLQHGFQE